MLVKLLLTLCGHVCVSVQALDKAKEAGRKERTLVRQREQSGNADINVDLTYSVSKAAVYQWLFLFLEMIEPLRPTL